MPVIRDFLTPALLLGALAASLLGCADALPNAPNGPATGPRIVLRTVPQQPGRLEEIEGIRVLTTQGRPFDEGYQHGYLLTDEITSFYHDYVEGKLFPSHWLTPGFTYGWYASKQEASLSSAEREEIRGLAAGSGLTYAQALILQLDPPWLPAASWLGRAYPPVAGSAAFIAQGSAVLGGDTLLGGNVSGLDFGLLHQGALLRVQHPLVGHAFVTPGFAGRVLDAWEGWNDRGLALAAVSVPVARENPSGIPIGVLTRRVIQHSASLAEAEQVIRQTRGLAQGAVLLLANREGIRRFEVAQSLEDAWHGRLRLQVGLPGAPPDPPGAVSAASRFRGPLARAVAFSDGAEDVRDRRIAALLRTHHGRLDVTRAAEMLTEGEGTSRDSAEPGPSSICLAGARGRESFGPFAWSAAEPATTFQSVVRDLDRGTLMVAQGRALITSPAQFRTLDLAMLLGASGSATPSARPR